jgi:thiol-disulfide isomerase/thioredoxin
MSATPDPVPASGLPLGRVERMALAAVAALLVLLLLWLRGGLHPAAPLERLARQSPDLATALANGRPTLVEFYADWCEACRTMAPAMEATEKRHRQNLDVVLLNVDNPRWQPEMERYAVNGIPQLELFDASGESVGRSIGARRSEELEALATALLEGRPLPELAGVGATSSLAVPTSEGDAVASLGAGAGSPGPDAAAAGLAPSLGRTTAVGPRSHG